MNYLFSNYSYYIHVQIIWHWMTCCGWCVIKPNSPSLLLWSAATTLHFKHQQRSMRNYLSLALVVLFYNANFFKALSLFFTQISSSLENNPSVTAESAVRLTSVPWVGRNASVSLQFPSHILHSGGFPNKFVTTDFSDCQADNSASLSTSSNQWFLSFEGCQIYPPRVSPCLSVKTSPARKQSHCLPCPLPSLSS